jgi:hypothetical protein
VEKLIERQNEKRTKKTILIEIKSDACYTPVPMRDNFEAFDGLKCADTF